MGRVGNVKRPWGVARTIAKSGKRVYKERETRDGSVWIWVRRNLYSSAWSRCRTPEGQGSAPSLSSHTAFDSAGLGLRSDHDAHIALFAKMHWPVLREPLGFLRDDPPHATTISRTLAGVPCEQLQGALTGWVARVAADQELDASVDGKWAKQSEDAQGNPLVMVNVLAHDLKLCLAQWPASEKRYEPRVLREQLGRLFEDYPGLRLLTMDALYAERDLCQAIVDHGRDYLVRVKGNQPTVLAALADGFAPEELGEPQAETLEKKRV